MLERAILTNGKDDFDITELINTAKDAYDEQMRTEEIKVRFSNDDLALLLMFIRDANGAILLGKVLGAEENTFKDMKGTIDKVEEQLEKKGLTVQDLHNHEKVLGYTTGVKLDLTGFDCFELGVFAKSVIDSLKFAGLKKEAKGLYKQLKKFRKKMERILDERFADAMEENEKVIAPINSVLKIIEENEELEEN